MRKQQTRQTVSRYLLWSGVLVPCLASVVFLNISALYNADKSSDTVDSRRKSSKTNYAPWWSRSNGQPSSSSNGSTTNNNGGSATIPPAVPVEEPPVASDWSQDFTTMPNGALDTSVWQFELGGGGWGNSQSQYYTNRTQNARIENGRLVIEARKESFSGYDYTSARLVTRQSFTPKYGTITFGKVRMPKGVGTWPALWMWPSTSPFSPSQLGGGGSADLANGEIDVMEYVGASPGEINASAHAYLNYPGHGERSGQVKVADADMAEHDYSVRWTGTSLTFMVDGKAYYTLNKKSTDTPATWPYDQPYFLILNLAMGGDWGGMNRSAFPPLGIDNNSSPWRFSIGSIKYTEE